MSQSIFGGLTSYEGQSLNDIQNDINEWYKYTEKTKNFLNEKIEYLKSQNYFNRIYDDFRLTLLSSINQQNTNLHDFEIILTSIENNTITEKEVNLLNNIGIRAYKFNTEYGKTYKENDSWKDYGDTLFGIVEDLYSHGRDYFVSIEDASNAALRLKDYITTQPTSNSNSIGQIIYGNNGIIAGTNSGNIVQNNTYNNSDFHNDIKSAIEEINKSTDIDSCHKIYVNTLLNDTINALDEDDKDKQNTCKGSLKGFLAGIGDKGLKIISILSSFASIASFFGISI